MSHTLSDLIELRHKYDCQKHPSFPKEYVPKVKYTDKTANGLTKCIVDWINLNGGQAERISNTGRYIDNKKIVTDILGIRRQIGSGQYIKGTGTNGTADISATINGRSVKIEVKMKDKQSDAQKRYQESIESAGGQYWIAHDFGEFIFQYVCFLDYIKKAP